jgi:prepilin-type N-terminal cleavage/methylation domain-containing protein
MNSRNNGFTLIEALVTLAILGVLLVALFQTISGTAQVSTSANSGNELLREGQIAQQILSARFKEACYVYPSGETITMGSGSTTENTLGTATNDWIVNTDPIVAMILPPNARDIDDNPGAFYRFFAYYAVKRSSFLAMGTVNSSDKPSADVNNDNSVWVIMEYRKNLTAYPASGTTKCAAMNGATITGSSGRMLVDYVSPVSPINSLFVVGANTVTYNLQLQRQTQQGNLIRVGQDTASSNLRGVIYPENLGL